MAKTKEQIKVEIETYIRMCGGSFSEWYAGIASDPEDRLFNEHRVQQNGYWIYRECENSDTAREIEDYFVNVLGTDGAPGGGDQTTKYVYAYKKTVNTSP
jgi:hypothetical protein